MYKFQPYILALAMTGCSLHEDISDITYRAGDMAQDMPTQDMPTPDMPVQDMPVQDMPVQDMPTPDMSPDSGPDTPPDMPDIPPDMPQSCVDTGCAATEVCNTVTGECGPCSVNAPCPGGQACEAGICVCPSDQVFCNDVCVEQSPAQCGESCAACPGGIGASAICESGACELECLDQTHIRYKNGCSKAGNVCPSADKPLAGPCDPVFQTGCQAGLMCSYTPRIGISCTDQDDCEVGELCNPGNNRCIRFESACVSDANATIPLGDSCAGTTDTCAPGYLCSANFCRQMCDPLTAAGCESDEFCVPIQVGSGAGLCRDAC